MASERNGKAPLLGLPRSERGVPQQPVLAQITHPVFSFNVVQDAEVERVLLVISKPNGEQHVFPFGADAAAQLGHQLAAPSIKVARG